MLEDKPSTRLRVRLQCLYNHASSCIVEDAICRCRIGKKTIDRVNDDGNEKQEGTRALETFENVNH